MGKDGKNKQCDAPENANGGGGEGTHRGRRKLPLWKKVLFSFLPLLFLFAAAEIYLRVYPPYKRIVGKTSGRYVVPDKDLVWKLAPVKEGYRAVNDVGYRDAPMNWNAKHKALLLGDSISWGDCVPHTDEIYPQVCERELSKRLGESVEIINTGTPGYSSLQELKLLQLRGKEFQPEVVILQFCLNDVVDRYRTMAAYGGDSEFLGIDTRAACHGFASLSQYSSVVEAITRYLQRRGRRYEEYQVKNLVTTTPSPEIEDAWSTTFAEIAEMKKFSESLGAKFMIVITPFKFQLDDPENTRIPQDKLLAFAKENGIEVLDLLPAFVEHKDEKLFADADHFAPRGHQIAAAELADVLEKILKPGAGKKQDSGD